MRDAAPRESNPYLKDALELVTGVTVLVSDSDAEHFDRHLGRGDNFKNKFFGQIDNLGEELRKKVDFLVVALDKILSRDGQGKLVGDPHVKLTNSEAVTEAIVATFDRAMRAGEAQERARLLAEKLESLSGKEIVTVQFQGYTASQRDDFTRAAAALIDGKKILAINPQRLQYLSRPITAFITDMYQLYAFIQKALKERGSKADHQRRYVFKELLKNALSHGNRWRFDLPIFVSFDKDQQIFVVYDLGIDESEGIPPPKDAGTSLDEITGEGWGIKRMAWYGWTLQESEPQPIYSDLGELLGKRVTVQLKSRKQGAQGIQTGVGNGSAATAQDGLGGIDPAMRAGMTRRLFMGAGAAAIGASLLDAQGTAVQARIQAELNRIDRLTHINGVPIPEIEKRCRPAAEGTWYLGSTFGFMGPEPEALKEDLKADHLTVIKLDTSHEALAFHLREIYQRGRKAMDEKAKTMTNPGKIVVDIDYDASNSGAAIPGISLSGARPVRLRFEYTLTRGMQESPFRNFDHGDRKVPDDLGWPDDFVITNLENGLRVHVGGNNVAGIIGLIERHGFYEGGGNKNPYRVDPMVLYAILTGMTVNDELLNRQPETEEKFMKRRIDLAIEETLKEEASQLGGQGSRRKFRELASLLDSDTLKKLLIMTRFQWRNDYERSGDYRNEFMDAVKEIRPGIFQQDKGLLMSSSNGELYMSKFYWFPQDISNMDGQAARDLMAKEAVNMTQQAVIIREVLAGRGVQIDQAMSFGMEKLSDDVGGIDLNQANMLLQIKRDGNGVPLPVAQQDLENIRIDGLVPTILEIRPVTSLPILSEASIEEPATVGS
jgi:hypothetical protein